MKKKRIFVFVILIGTYTSCFGWWLFQWNDINSEYQDPLLYSDSLEFSSEEDPLNNDFNGDYESTTTGSWFMGQYIPSSSYNTDFNNIDIFDENEIDYSNSYNDSYDENLNTYNFNDSENNTDLYNSNESNFQVNSNNFNSFNNNSININQFNDESSKQNNERITYISSKKQIQTLLDDKGWKSCKLYVNAPKYFTNPCDLQIEIIDPIAENVMDISSFFIPGTSNLLRSLSNSYDFSSYISNPRVRISVISNTNRQNYKIYEEEIELDFSPTFLQNLSVDLSSIIYQDETLNLSVKTEMLIDLDQFEYENNKKYWDAFLSAHNLSKRYTRNNLNLYGSPLTVSFILKN